MSERFLIRFNLQNEATEETRREYLDEFERMQSERIDRLKNTYHGEINILRGKRILFLGDSITSDNLGYRMSVSRAAELLATDGSVSGATTDSLLPLAREKIGEARYDLISIMLGANDSVTLVKEGRNQVSLDEYVANMDKILGCAKESGASVLLLGITPVHEERFQKSFFGQNKSQTNQTVARYNHRLEELADKHGVPLMNHLWLTEDLFLEHDGIHLTPSGQEHLSEAWLIAASKCMKEKEE